MKKRKKDRINITKAKRNSFLKDFLDVIKTNGNDMPQFIKHKKYKKENINVNSWFNSYKFINKTERTHIVKSYDKLDNNKYKQIKIKMVLNDTHKQILQKWFTATTLIYNETLKFIRQNYVFTKKEITRDILNRETKISKNFYDKRYIRNQLNEIKKHIQKDTTIIISKENTLLKTNNIKCQIDMHTLDKSIFQLVENIKGSVTNMFNGNIKRFRLKFWKFNRPSKIMSIEKIKITDGIFCKSIFEHLEPIKYFYDGEPYNINNIDSDFKINYNSITNEYLLLVSVKTEKINKVNNNKIIVLDPGLRTFMTGLSNNEHLIIGNNVHSSIKEKVKRLNKIKNNKDIPQKIKDKNEKLINKKIKNKIDELHWKTINYLINGYSTIFLGDMSAKSIVKKENSVLSNESKVACLRTRYYDFRLRLKYKCSVNNRKFKLVNEYYTSKTCSLCGSYKIYSCSNCSSSIDRDVNGCRNIYMKQFVKDN
jgi:hypothetical protein